MDPYHHHLPEVGQTRCYWALLSADLQFIYLDPVLAYHLDSQADQLIGKSLLSFVHPDEQASAKSDLRGVLDSRTLHGSVTRVRLLRLSKVRRNLGHTGSSPLWSEAEKIVVDENYMAVDIVINWAAEGLVLCFIHASVDLDPQNDNDETNKSDWTNWCGTPHMPPEQIQLLFRRLLICVPHSPSPSGTPARIFQILANQPRRQLLLSWPPDQGNGLTGREFAKLVENAEMGSGPQKGNDAKTSCTRRYRATQLMSPTLGEVESIFIPHGTVIFACHKVESSSRSTSTPNPTAMHNQISYNSNDGPSYPPPPGPSYYDSPTSSYPPLYTQGYLTHQSLPPQPPPPPTSAYSSPRWSQQNYPQPQPPSAQTQWATPSPTHPLSPLPTSTSVPPPSSSMTHPHIRPASYSTTPVSGPPPSSSAWHATPSTYDYYRGSSPGYSAYSTGTGRTPLVGTSILPTPSSLLSATAPGVPPPQPPPPANMPSSIADVVPPPKRRVSPGSIRGGGATAIGGGDQYHPGGAAGASTTTSNPGGRGSGNRPAGVLECSSCGATSSPEWRKGPSGKKELCNACGLRYARSRAKKDGGASSGHGRKKKSSDPNTGTSTAATGSGGGLKTEPLPSDIKSNPHHPHHPHPPSHHRHIVGGTGSSNGTDVKRHRKRDSIGSAGAGGGVTPPLATIAAASGSPGYASTMLRKGGLGSTGSDPYATTGTPPGGGSDGHGHAHYAALAAGAGAGEGNNSGNGKVLTPSPSPPIGTAIGTGATGGSNGPGASTSIPSTTSGSLGLHLSDASPTSSSPSLSVPSVGSGLPPQPQPQPTTSASSALVSQSESGTSAQDLGFMHYNSAPGTQHDRVIPPLNVHPHSHSHPHSHPHPHSHSHSHSHHSHPTSPHSHSHSPSGSHPSLPGFSAAAHHVYSGYTARPSPLSQAGNLVTGPGAANAGPLTPLSSVPPHSANAETAGDSEENVGSTSGGNNNGGGMQLPPLAYMDRLVQSGSGYHHHHHYGPLVGGVKLDYGTSPESDSSAGTGGGFQQQQQNGTISSSMGREPLTPLSAESPIGPGVGRNYHHHHNHQHAAGARRTILGGGQ